jgi:alpha-glucosidase (family GH31 glycosyl hydrolase)
MSTAGYGAFRNTFKPGKYSFHDPLSLSHNEFRFDCYYFYGLSLKKILDGYTQITGRPFMPPRWALEAGDANCYNRKGTTTPVVIDSIAKKYREHDMPGGWILPNDGYGCGYTKLDSTVKELHKYGFYTGLWTENGVERIKYEVGTTGTRLCKLDVAWVYRGYDFALDACKTAFTGIEDNSDARGFVWSVMGWAGTQRYSTVWTGDQSGDWEYIRFHIPTVIGSGLSAQNAATGDIDGIFGGSPKTYVRDLQWKCFTPVLMSMSGWAKYMKQPYIYGDPYTSINRKYLKLKMRLTPYIYTYCNEAWETGTPTVRGMVLEFPDDPVSLGKETQYQFMSGEWLLVAPVFKDEEKRDSIYFPEGTWIDYWDGTKYKGPVWISDYNAPLEKLPLFVKSGAIIPMYPEMLYDNEKPKDPVTLDIYPDGNTAFELYEDDGLTREHRKGIFAKTLIEVKHTGSGTQIVVHPVKGSYKGMPAQRKYILQIHLSQAPVKVRMNGKKVKLQKSRDKYEASETGWYFNPADHKGMVYIKTKPVELKTGFSVNLE